MMNIYGVRLGDTFYYVGQTKHDPRLRLRQTISCGRALRRGKHSGGNEKYKQWCVDNETALSVEVLEQVKNTEANHRELDWIEYLIQNGHPLLNVEGCR